VSDRAPAVAEQKARLRQAGVLLRQRSLASRLDALGAVLERFRDADGPERRALEAGLPDAAGLAPGTVRAGLALALAHWDAAALRALAARELGAARDESATGGAGTWHFGFPLTAVVLAGVIPMPTLLALLAPLVLGSPVLARPARHDPVTAALLARALAEVDPGLGVCLELLDGAGHEDAAMASFLDADCVVATGSDETVATLAARVRPPRRFVGHGHRLSLAVLGPGALGPGALPAVARALALDVALWDQLGCLSPVSVHVLAGAGRSGVAAAADAVAEALATELAGLEATLPRGTVPLEARAARAAACDEAALRAGAGRPVRVLGAPDGPVVVRESDARPRSAPLHRFVRVHPAAGPGRLLEALAPLGPHLAGVALAGFGEDTAEVARALAHLGASRICAPGRLQAPPLGWHHDGEPVLLPLARLADVEADAVGAVEPG